MRGLQRQTVEQVVKDISQKGKERHTANRGQRGIGFSNPNISEKFLS